MKKSLKNIYFEIQISRYTFLKTKIKFEEKACIGFRFELDLYLRVTKKNWLLRKKLFVCLPCGKQIDSRDSQNGRTRAPSADRHFAAQKTPIATASFILPPSWFGAVNQLTLYAYLWVSSTPLLYFSIRFLSYLSWGAVTLPVYRVFYQPWRSRWLRQRLRRRHRQPRHPQRRSGLHHKVESWKGWFRPSTMPPILSFYLSSKYVCLWRSLMTPTSGRQSS